MSLSCTGAISSPEPIPTSTTCRVYAEISLCFGPPWGPVTYVQAQTMSGQWDSP